MSTELVVGLAISTPLIAAGTYRLWCVFFKRNDPMVHPLVDVACCVAILYDPAWLLLMALDGKDASAFSAASLALLSLTALCLLFLNVLMPPIPPLGETKRWGMVASFVVGGILALTLAALMPTVLNLAGAGVGIVLGVLALRYFLLAPVYATASVTFTEREKLWPWT